MSNSAYTPNTGVTAPIDPGWNDPPKFSYNAQNTPSRPRNVLNKRVAFPLTITTPNPVLIPTGNIPSMSAAIISPVPCSQTVQNAPSQDETDIDNQKTLEEVRIILLGLLDTSPELGSKGNDIRKRIDIMEDMWNNGKLNNKIFLHMRNLAYALRDDMPSKADDIHRELMVNHVSAVGTWMPGIKQLIHNCIARSELLSIDKE